MHFKPHILFNIIRGWILLTLNPTITEVFGRYYLSFVLFANFTAQKVKFSIKDFFHKCDQIRIFLWIWSHLLKKSLMENFIFCVMLYIVHIQPFIQARLSNSTLFDILSPIFNCFPFSSSCCFYFFC